MGENSIDPAKLLSIASRSTIASKRKIYGRGGYFRFRPQTDMVDRFTQSSRQQQSDDRHYGNGATFHPSKTGEGLGASCPSVSRPSDKRRADRWRPCEAVALHDDNGRTPKGIAYETCSPRVD
jgi:hypothetical protein